MNLRKLTLYLIMFCIMTLFAELLSFGILYGFSLARGTNYLPNLAKEIFKVGNFTEKVNDERIVTAKSNAFSKSNFFTVFTSQDRFRVNYSSNKKEADDQRRKLLFIGDSVPFGYGVPAEESIPYLTQIKLNEMKILNGAIPSYSLLQARKRLEIEFFKINNVEWIYLQIYDPVSQYSLMGDNWSKDQNWGNFNEVRESLKKTSMVCKLTDFRNFSSFIKLFFISIGKAGFTKEFLCFDKVEKVKKDTSNRFKSHVINEIQKIKNIAKIMGAKLILAPIVPNPKAYNKLSNFHTDAIETLNSILKKQEDDSTYYLALKNILNDEKYFIDSCCHLSKEGADLVSKQIIQLIKK